MNAITELKKRLRSGTADAFSAIKDAIRVIGGKDKCITLHNRNNYNWNHVLCGFYLNDKDEVCVRIYWQGDSTDGYKCESLYPLASASRSKSDYFIASEWDGHYERHGKLRIDPFELREACLLIADDLNDGVRSRMENRARTVALDEIQDSRYSQVWYWQDSREMYWNGKLAVYAFLSSDPEKYMAMPQNDLRKIIREVYEINELLDKEIAP